MSKIVRIVDDYKDIQIAIHSTLNDFLNKYDLIRWERANKKNDNINLYHTSNCIASNNFSNLKDDIQIGNYSFKELVNIFNNKTFTITVKLPKMNVKIGGTVNALDLFISYYDYVTKGMTLRFVLFNDECNYLYNVAIPYYVDFELIALERTNMLGVGFYKISSNGSLFYTTLRGNGLT